MIDLLSAAAVARLSIRARVCSSDLRHRVIAYTQLSGRCTPLYIPILVSFFHRETAVAWKQLPWRTNKILLATC